MSRLIPEQKIHYTLRIAVAMCFIGHGSFGIITKPIWCNYFAVFGIGQHLSYQLMPVLGTFDILVGVCMLAYPLRAIPAWLVIWGLVTASLRPLSGEPFAEFIERAGNFGAPVALLLLSGYPGKTIAGAGGNTTGGNFLKGWFTRIDPDKRADRKTQVQVITCLKIVVFLLLLGHGWLNLIEKKGLLSQYTALGFPNPAAAAQAVGFFEIIAACTILIRPIGPVLLTLLIWKIVSEFFYPHWEFFEWIERGGSYGSILALWFAVRRAPQTFLHKPNMTLTT